ncbi:2-oxoacid:ferredoxin oxidoreductase subunit beta [Candidatus Peregrinibacteria bacterium]|jgi:2-oxoglutarate/2-oxoacid ferredoxin oxidoreductase subunit beta|nr:2-oxoacid:ferredoxin oxidoreductase subunit beta [Candidatus Peregrinibacteria bacterium]MBT4631535.1 2-oxoacid:ferredoxin oxidoreductase subunit beta [Candidatus Peregrinibacteria bacterium]MBT5516370.1 2-oxoacid:ferredoxin oxidoreductase subunit beta [Candidatus Peregrinibacteria bacterium]MBT5824273.1 2-oxoacid:ferredoxin oxidoreductase subunit beta [Candidatus Peregrinibacteria bacterium]
MSKTLKILNNVQELDTGSSCNWCPGCGDFGILLALKQAIFDLKLDPESVMLVSGIGCGSQAPHLIKVYGFHSLHGRTLPVATAMKLANNKMTVIAIGGDGDGYGIGMGHFIHAARRNFDITYIVQNNQVYGLTKGQTSPTSEHGYKSKTTPEGVIEPMIRPIALSMTAGASFCARGFAGDIMYLKELIKAGIQHKGFSHIDVLQPCVTFNKINTYQWYQQRIYKLSDVEGYDPSSRTMALEKAEEWGEKIPVGVYYKEDRWTYEDKLPMIAEKPLVDHSIENIDIGPAIESYF